MHKRWDEALRSLARRCQSSFRVMAYGVSGSAEGEAELRSDLESMLRSRGLDGSSEIVTDQDNAFSGALQREGFRSRVIPWLDSFGRRTISMGNPPASPPVPDARKRLESLASELSGFLDSMEVTPAHPGGIVGSSTSSLLRSLPPVPETAPRPARRPLSETPLLAVLRLEDLGGDAEGIAASVQRIVTAGAHLIIVSEDLDTRTREGRAIAALILRLGSLKAARAREHSLQELGRRRETLKVYGPVPFGFTCSEGRLIPVKEQMETVARARELARRSSLFDAALVLNRERRVWKDGTPWTGRRVRQVLKNPIYDRTLRGDIA